jgi:phosphoserine aminotransferase
LEGETIMEKRIFNFSAGPAVLPLPVLKKAQEDLLCYPGGGASIMEISHRSKAFLSILEQTKADMKALLNLPDNYHVLFCPGGASMQFCMLAMNFLNGKSADYVMTGSWASKAASEAKKQGTARPAWSGKDENYVRMPKPGELDLDPNAAYVHFTSNETIQGIECFEEPDTGGVPLICDASSDFLSHPIAIEKYAMIYAGAQKNIGPSGMAAVILRNDLLERVPQNLPSMLDYKIVVENDSLYNTPSTFTIYIIGLVLKWLREEVGGLNKIAEINQKKAKLIYDAIDESGGFYKGHAQSASRSLMNITFRLPDEAMEKEFISQATAAGLDGLKGHRSVGGCRASIYNAMAVEGCQALRDFMVEFQKKKG